MKDRLKRLIEKVDALLTRDSRRLRFIAWRDRVTKVIVFIDHHLFRIIAIILLLFFIFSVFYIFAWRAPRPFPEHALVTVEKGQSLSQIANSFESNNVIRSSFWLKFFGIFLGGGRKMVAGDYYFPNPKSVFGVAWMLHKGEFGLIPLRTTIIEGSSSYEIAENLKEILPAFSAEDFIKEVEGNGYEGTLFPDTYFFMPNTKASDVILMMRENFARNIKDYEDDIAQVSRPIDEIVIMASILEGEANNLESKRIISGILWKRIANNMPLQVDAPFKYYNGKNSYTLTKDDLNEDHSYNTYKNEGLPPTAINNPGIDSIRAAIAPTQTEYWYFLSSRAGNMYYARDFEGHKHNRELYLD